MFPGETKRDFSTAPGRTYFFLVQVSARHDAVTGTTMVADGRRRGCVCRNVGSDNTGSAASFR